MYFAQDQSNMMLMVSITILSFFVLIKNCTKVLFYELQTSFIKPELECFHESRTQILSPDVMFALSLITITLPLLITAYQTGICWVGGPLLQV